MHIFRGQPVSTFLCRISAEQNLPGSWGRTIGNESETIIVEWECVEKVRFFRKEFEII